MCDRHDKSLYPQFKTWADEYYRIPHRNETRGLGGIFYDDLNDRDPEDLFKLSKDLVMSVRRLRRLRRALRFEGFGLRSEG